MTEQNEGTERVALREEELKANRQTVDAGAVQVDKDVVTEHRDMDIPKMREEVTVSRLPVEGRAAEGEIGEGDSINVPLRQEQVTVDKQPYVREELELNKRQVQDTEHVSADVNREEANVHKTGDVVEE